MSYFSRVSLDRDNPEARNLLRHLASNAYNEHQLLWGLWGLWGRRPEALRDFLFHRRDEVPGSYYLVSAAPPLESGHGFLVESRPYQPRVEAGDQLAFELRANPVVTRRTDDGRAVRHDVVTDALAHSEGRVPRDQLERDAGLAWLARRAEASGFTFDPEQVRTGAYRKESFQRGAQRVRYSTLDFAGLLTVAEAERFGTVLRNGLGKARAFGCGLLLIRRV